MCNNLFVPSGCDRIILPAVVGLAGKDVTGMMTTIQNHVQLWRQTLRRWVLKPKVHTGLRATGFFLAGFLLSAAGLSHYAQPLALGFVCALTGWHAVLSAVGAAVGYLLFWGTAGTECLLWCGFGLALTLLFGRTRLVLRSPLLMPAFAGLVIALSGLLFQHRGADTPMLIHLLRIGLAMGTTRLFAVVLQRRDSVADWFACGAAVLALAQVAPFPYCSLGYPAAAALCVAGAFPAAALAGLALDLANITAVPMTAVLCLAWLTRLVPARRNALRALTPALVFPAVMVFSGQLDLQPLPGLLLGGFLGLLLPGSGNFARRRGEVGVTQVRLELAGTAFGQMQQLLMEAGPPPIQLQDLILLACERACGSCPSRKNCPTKQQANGLPLQILDEPILDTSLPFSCRRSGRLLQELRRSQEQLRLLRANHRRQEECRSALIQQYRFLCEYLQDLSDELGKRAPLSDPRFQAEVAFCGNRSLAENGDRCLSFPGICNRYYVAICDGMGTGIGAIDEAETAGKLLKRLLSAGYPAEYALGSLNSLCALRGRAGAVTVDLAELHLDTGKALLYKWGAAPSWLVSRAGSEKIGTAGPPPGLSVADCGERASRLSLRRGELLVMQSDGVGGEDMPNCRCDMSEPLGELAARILESGHNEDGDDATVAVVRLAPRS